MPLQIRECTIRTTLTDDIAEGSKKKQDGTATAPQINVEHIIAECMERLKEWLREENER